jgi:plasmid stabilization system protein ParE
VEYKVFFSDDALRDLDEILEFIRKDKRAAAEHFGNALLNHVDLLASFPHMGAPVARLPGVRQFLHTPIRIYYPIDEDRRTVDIVHLWHGSRRLPL